MGLQEFELNLLFILHKYTHINK